MITRVNVPFNFKKMFIHILSVRLQKNGEQVKIKNRLVDVDSEFGITRKNSKCSEDYYPCSDKLQYGLSCNESLEHGEDGFVHLMIQD